MGLIGTREAFPKGSWLPRRRKVEIRFGKPFKLRAEFGAIEIKNIRVKE